MTMLLIQSNTPGLLTLNGQFCGRVDDSPHSYLTHRSDRGYLFFSPFDDARSSLTREIRVQDDQLLPPDEGIYALQWHEGVCQLELRPSSRPGDAGPAQDALPVDAQDIQKRPVFDGCTLLTCRTARGECARLYDAAALPVAALDARRLTWDTPEIVPAFEEAVAPYKKQDEDVLTYALFPQVALDYFKYRDAQETGVDAKVADTENKAYPV